MHCDKCNKKKVTVMYHENIGGSIRTLRLCADCAREMEQAGELEEISAAFAAFSSPMLSVSDRPHRLAQAATPKMVGDRVCSVCGIKECELVGSGRAGCATCYEVFENLWSGSDEDKRGAGEYRGQVPRLVRVRSENVRQMSLLRAQLVDAVKGEQYEQAAILRDRMRELETGINENIALGVNGNKEGH